jgi:hypothetical protein
MLPLAPAAHASRWKTLWALGALGWFAWTECRLDDRESSLGNHILDRRGTLLAAALRCLEGSDAGRTESGF